MTAAANGNELERRTGAAARLTKRPGAVAFVDAPPAGVPSFEGSEPSGRVSPRGAYTMAFGRRERAARAAFDV